MVKLELQSAQVNDESIQAVYPSPLDLRFGGRDTRAMQILEPSSYGNVLPLLPSAHDAGHLTFSRAVLEGRMPGRILVDDVANPASANVLNDCGFDALLGSPPSEPLGPLLESISNEHMSEEPGLLVDVTGTWTAVLEPLLGAPFGRKEYHPPLEPPRDRPLAAGFELVPITVDVANLFEGAVDPWVVRIWGGAEAFVATAPGFAVLAENGDLAAFCTACGIGGGEAEIEIGTNDRYRRLGLARVAAVAFIDVSKGQGLVPAWTCQADNEPSWRLADSLGFREFRTVNCFNFNRGFKA